MKKITLFIILSLISNLLQAEDVYLLTKSLQFSSNPNMSDQKIINANNEITLFKILEELNGNLKVQLIQKNGKPANQILYVSERWFKRGADLKDDSFAQLNLNPHDALISLNTPKITCAEATKSKIVKKETNKVTGKGTAKVAAKDEYKKIEPSPECDNVLENPKSTVQDNMNCFQAIQQKFKDRLAEKKQSKRAYKVMSGLYELNKNEQKFMANILTMYGEARGARPKEEQMAGVMQVIQNRTRQAKEKGYPDANELDTVLQNSQFSMFNTNDNNWEAAMTATPEEMSDVIKVYQNRNNYIIKTNQSRSKNQRQSQNDPEKVYHYITQQLSSSQDRPAWSTAQNQVSMTVNGSSLGNSSGHVFFQDIPWTFEPTNKYKKYAQKEGAIL